MKALFVHQKLDWTIGKLEVRARGALDDVPLRMELARCLLSRGLFHGTGENDCTQALALARKTLNEDPAHAEALVVAGLALLGMDRQQAAARYLEQAEAIEPERPDLFVGLGMSEQVAGDPGSAVRHYEAACRVAPDAWECHLLLGRALMSAARSQGHPRRLIERSQYHLVQALKREPPADQAAPLLKDLGISCMLTGRYREAEKFFIRLREHQRHAPSARYHLGQVAYEMGKYNNAIQHFRQYLRDRPDEAKVLARMAMAWFQLGDYRRARETCHQALMADPADVTARHALGCTLAEEGETTEAVKVFREALKEQPDHLPSYIEMVRLRRALGDQKWLVQALETEVGNYDRLPLGGKLDARRVTRERIRVVLDELRSVGPSTIRAVLGAIDRTQDEGLRFLLWEASCALATASVADGVSARLRDPGRNYGAEVGGQALAVATGIPEPVLSAALQVEETDLKRATVDRHGPAHDVQQHRRNLDLERNRARAWQALLLLAIGMRRSAAGKALLRSWAEAADAELAAAAWAGLAMYGEPDATRRLAHRADHRGAGRVVERLLAQITPRAAHREPRRVSDGEQTRCTTCGRQPDEVTHMMAGGEVVICDQCVLKVRQHRSTLAAPDGATCGLCGRTPFEASGLYRYNGIDVCSSCLQLSLGLLEREEVDRFLAAW